MTEESAAATEAAPVVSESTRHVVTKVVVHAMLTGAELRAVPYSSHDRQYRPVAVHIVYSKRDDAPWHVDGVDLTGPKMVKSGKPGQAGTVEKWYGRPRTLPWLAELVDQLTPFDVEQVAS